MAEIPEHLLRRSKERRAAVSGGGDAPSEGGAAPAGEAAAPKAATPAKAAPAKAAAPSLPATAPRPAGPPPLPPTRARVPFWVSPLFLALPIFGFFYAQGYQPKAVEGPTDPLVLGAEVYRSSGCSGCHGGTGEGGVGPALNGEESELTFPDEADQIAWVKSGSAPFTGQEYGNPDRPGGARVATGGMPGFNGQLSEEEIEAVVLYEREQL